MDTRTSFKTPTLMGRKGLCFRWKKEREKRRREGGAGGGYLYSLGGDCQENLCHEVFADNDVVTLIRPRLGLQRSSLSPYRDARITKARYSRMRLLWTCNLFPVGTVLFAFIVRPPSTPALYSMSPPIDPSSQNSRVG